MSAQLEAYSTWLQSTGPWWSRSVEEVVNDTYRNSFIYGRFFNGKDANMELIQGGTKIQDIVLLDYQRTSKYINPGTKTPVQNIQSGTRIEIPWAFLRGQTTVDDQELMLNGGGGGGGYAQKYKSVRYQKDQVLKTDLNERVDDVVIGEVPTFDSTESATPPDARIPHSLHTFINEYNTEAVPYLLDGSGPALIGGFGGAGLLPTEVTGGSAWTTVETVDPTISGQENWRPVQVAHSTSAAYDPDGDANQKELFQALSEAFRRTGIDQLPMGGEYSDPRSTPNCIFTSNEGMTFIETALRTQQSYFFGMGQRGGQDPHYQAPVFNNVPFIYISSLDTIPLYLNDAQDGATTEMNATAEYVGPRFIGCNGKYILPFIHSEKYWEQTGLLMPDGMPETRVQYTHLWHNTGCRSRRRQFHIRPGTPTT